MDGLTAWLRCPTICCVFCRVLRPRLSMKLKLRTFGWLGYSAPLQDASGWITFVYGLGLHHRMMLEVLDVLVP